MKECNKCKQVTDRYYKHKWNKDGLSKKCIDCTLKEQRKYYIEHKCTPEARAKQKAYNDRYRQLKQTTH